MALQGALVLRRVRRLHFCCFPCETQVASEALLEEAFGQHGGLPQKAREGTAASPAHELARARGPLCA